MDNGLLSKPFITLIAVILLSVALALGVVYINKHQDLFKKAVVKYSPVSREPSTFSLEVNNPDDNILSKDQNQLVSGKTQSQATLIITVNSDTYGVTANTQGDFSKIVKLFKGPNIITINTFDPQGNQKKVVKNVYFTQESIDE